jgi:acyl-CoA thioesterase FadM
MRLRLRLLLVFIASFFRRRLRLDEENILSLRVLPNDVDVSLVSADRYLALMDLGRINIVLRAGMFGTLVANRWAPVVRVATVRYRYPLKLFQKYQLRTRVVYWDQEWAWTEHVFERNGRVTAVGLTKTMFKSRDGLVPLAKFIAASGQSPVPPALPEVIARLQTVEGLLKERQAETA